MHSQHACRDHSSSVSMHSQLRACAGLVQRPGQQAHGLIMARVCASAWLVAACSSQSSTFAASVSPERARTSEEAITHRHQVCRHGCRGRNHRPRRTTTLRARPVAASASTACGTPARSASAAQRWWSGGAARHIEPTQLTQSSRLTQAAFNALVNIGAQHESASAG